MSKKLPRGQIIELGGEPRINFLPGEIQERKDARRRLRALFVLVILVAILCGIGFVYSAQYAAERTAALEQEQNTTLQLLAQQAEYSEAKARADEVALTGQAITHLSHNEVFWRGVILETLGALPSGAKVSQWAVVGVSALEYPQPSAGLFPLERVASIDVHLVANSMTTVTAAVERLSSAPGVIDVNFASAQLDSDAGGYVTILTVSFSSDVLQGRFKDGWVPGALEPEQPASPPSTDPDTGNDEEEIGGESE